MEIYYSDYTCWVHCGNIMQQKQCGVRYILHSQIGFIKQFFLLNWYVNLIVLTVEIRNVSVMTANKHDR